MSLLLVLPNGLELALSILAVSPWLGLYYVCFIQRRVPYRGFYLNVERCGPDLIIGPLTAATTFEKHQADKVDGN